MKLLLRCLLLLLALPCLLPLQHCATPTSPQGGPRDSIPPQLVLDESTSGFQTNFRPEKIELTFDEWVELDPKQTIVVSPPIAFGADQRPTLERRTLVIPLEGVELIDDVTYVVNIGSAIKDLNEGNPTENLRFVFATGAVLDSASVSGKLVDAFTGEPMDATTFTLYGDLSDSAVFRKNPTYFAQTDESGDFTVFNVKPGTYRAVALLRKTGSTNYFLDFAGNFAPTSVGYVDTVVTVTDGENTLGTVRLSPVPIEVRAREVDTSRYGLLAIQVNQPAEGVDLSYSGDYLRIDQKDTIKLFYSDPAADTILLGLENSWADTVLFSPSAEVPPSSYPAPLSTTRSVKGRSAGDAAGITFTRPLDTFDLQRILLLRDTLPEPIEPTVGLDTLDPFRLNFRAAWEPRKNYALTLLPGAVTDFLGTSNQDTIRQRLNFNSPEAFGTLNLSLTELNPTFQYILRLIDGDETVLGSERIITDRFTYGATYANLAAGTYRVELLYDVNRNKRYDGGDFRFNRQPEVVRRFEIQAVRANWEVEETIVVGED